MRGHQYGAEGDQEFELLLVAAGGFREVAAQRERAAEQAGGLGIGVPVTGLRGGRQIVANGRFGHASSFTVGCQLAADRLRFHPVKFFQRARDATVQKAPPHGTEFRISDFAEAIVGEIVLRHAMLLALPFDEAALPQFVQGGGQAIVVPVGGLGEQIEREGLADGAGQPGQFVRRGGELRQAGGDDGVDAGRRRGGRVRGLRTGIAQARANAFHDEQGIAFRRPVESAQIGGIKRTVGHLGRQCRGLFGVERREGKFHGLPGLAQVAQQTGERVAPASLFGPHGADYQDSCGRVAPKQRVQPFEGVRIAPLQVVDQQEQGAAGLAEHRVQGVVEVAPFPTLCQGMRPLDGRVLRQNLRHHACQFRELRLGQLRTRGAQGLRPQPAGDGSVGEAAVGGVASRARHGAFLVRAPFVQFLGQAGFADARLALDQRQMLASAHGRAPAFEELLPFLAPSHHGRRRFCHGRREFRACAGERLRAQYLIEKLPSGHIRIHAEFAAQDLFALVIGAQCAGTVVMGGVQADEHLVVRFGQGIESHQAFGVADGSGIVAPLFEQQRQAEQRVPQLAAVMFPLREKPVVVKAAQQIVLVKARGFFECRALDIRIASFGGVRRAREGGLEFHDVDGAGGVAAPLHAVVIRLQVATFGRQCSTQVMEQLTEIGAGLGLDGFRPEEKCELFAWLRRLAIEHEPGQQGLEAVGVDRQDRLLRAGDQQIIVPTRPSDLRSYRIARPKRASRSIIRVYYHSTGTNTAYHLVRKASLYLAKSRRMNGPGNRIRGYCAGILVIGNRSRTNSSTASTQKAARHELWNSSAAATATAAPAVGEGCTAPAGQRGFLFMLFVSRRLPAYWAL